MEGLPRTPQPGERRAVNRAEQPTYRQPEEPRPVVEYPKVAPRSNGSRREKSNGTSSKKGLIWGISIAVLVLLLALVGWMIFTNSKSTTTGIDTSKYQSVYLMNGQIYFGKLSAQGDSQLKLTNVYYLQTPAADATTGGEADTSDDSKAQLIIKLTKAIYDPEDEMIISKDQVLYFQNLKSDSRASQLIENDKS